MATTTETDMMNLFSSVETNEGGWGPVGAPDKFKHLPYQVFNKSDKIGKICDWSGNADQYGGRRCTF